MATPSENWPKPWLLQLHDAAVTHGFIWVEPISEADAKSLRARLYRMRRRSDTSMAAYIPAEYHLVMVGQWVEGPDGIGRLPLIYNKLPDGRSLPNIVPATADEVTTYLQVPKAPAPPIIDAANLDPAAIQISPDEISGFVADLRRKARKE